MKRKYAALSALLCLLALLFSGCKYRISITKVEDETESGSQAETSTEAPTETTTEPTTIPEPTTLDPLTEAGMIYESENFRAVAMDKTAVLSLYTAAMNEVKTRCPGFSKKSDQNIGEVSAGNGRLQLANKVLNLIASEVLKSTGDGNYEERIPAHSDVLVTDNFPLYGSDKGCELEDASILSSAACYTDGERYKLVLMVRDTLNPEPGDDGFSRILTPVARQKVADGIAEYLLVLDENKYKFDFDYTGNEIICVIDRDSGRMEYLSQKMIIGVDIVLDLDLVLLQTDFIKASGTIVNHVEYTAFDWTEE